MDALCEEIGTRPKWSRVEVFEVVVYFPNPLDLFIVLFCIKKQVDRILNSIMTRYLDENSLITFTGDRSLRAGTSPGGKEADFHRLHQCFAYWHPLSHLPP